MARQPALALDRLDHGALFAADVGAGAAADVHLGVLGEPGRLQLRDLRLQDLQHGGVFIAHVDEDLLGLHRPRGDQHALQKLVRLLLQVDAVLEGAGLALVAVDRHHARALLGAHQAPLASRRETRAAEPAQAAVGKRRDHVLHLALAGQAGAQHRVAAGFHVSVEVLVGRHIRMHVPAQREFLDLGRRRMIDVAVADLGRGRCVA